jgi:acetyl-CoA carboxylase carboxyltransferase component
MSRADGHTTSEIIGQTDFTLMSAQRTNASRPKPTNAETWDELLREYRQQRAEIALGGGKKAIERQHEKNRLTARERIAGLIDKGTEFFELGRWAAWGMYEEWGGAPSAGVVCGIGRVASRSFMIIANDATVKAGAFFPATCKKVLRAQRIALINRLPLIYLVDSAGAFLPLQDEIFPDEDDFGRIFRNNSVLSGLGVPQIAAIMGNCVAGGGYLPVLCDKLVMTEGSGLYLAGPALVKSSIGQDASHEDLGGAKMHAAISGTIDFREENDEAALKRVRLLADTLPKSSGASHPWSRPAT